MKRMLLISVVVLALFDFAGCARKIAEFEIPEGYVGWVTVSHGAADCPAGTRNFWGSVIRIQPDGTACSQTWSAEGLRVEWYFYVGRDGHRLREIKETGWGKGGEIWAGYSSPSESKIHFFVGTETQFNETKTRPP